MPRDNEDGSKQKPTVSNDNHDENIGQRGDEPDYIGKPHGINEEQDSRGNATVSGGNKVHGDKLEGFIGSESPSERANHRPTRDDGDNDDEGALGGNSRTPR